MKTFFSFVFRWVKRFFILTILGVIACILGVGWAYYCGYSAGKGRLFDRVEDVPATKVGLIFGTSPKVGEWTNYYFEYRIDAAVALWKASRIRYILVSGDNRSKYYNEPEAMKNALMERGIPEKAIICDYAGLRTLDSVVRAKEVFGLKEVTFISQRFQNERAAYIGEAHGIRCHGFNARDVTGKNGARIQTREIGARVVMWFDVNILHTQPKHLGPPVSLPN
jgi:SanA protein